MNACTSTSHLFEVIGSGQGLLTSTVHAKYPFCNVIQHASGAYHYYTHIGLEFGALGGRADGRRVAATRTQQSRRRADAVATCNFILKFAIFLHALTGLAQEKFIQRGYWLW